MNYEAFTVKWKLENLDHWTCAEKPHAMPAGFKLRPMQPEMVLSVRGLDPRTQYGMTVKLKRVNNYSYDWKEEKFVTKNAGTRKAQFSGEFINRKGLQTGKEWMRTPFKFDDLKLTKNLRDQSGALYIVTRRCYQPVLTIFKNINGERVDVGSWEIESTQFVIVPEDMLGTIRKERLKIFGYKARNEDDEGSSAFPSHGTLVAYPNIMARLPINAALANLGADSTPSTSNGSSPDVTIPGFNNSLLLTPLLEPKTEVQIKLEVDD